MKQKVEEQRNVDKMLSDYGTYHFNQANFIIQVIFLPLLIFSLMGLITATPFPYLAFLGKYNMFINWFSIVLALAIYYYLKQSPLLSYIMLFTFGALYFFIVQLEYVEQAGGIKLWEISLLIFVVSLLFLLLGNQNEEHKLPLSQFWKKIIIGPIWLWSLVLKRFNLKY
ncbi:Mpo1-like protein [Pseudopedobacter saltans]|nr:Mpo1-like protein [Pseudopedobacter saltans]